ncbi:(2Fe-2S)-binding protein [Polynucleobacter wuianus]|uniref:(2Fe-2S)-binding protein n=1 Tax=Polynucleobacter wuianus TaxID=1743168 RepID=A0A191UDR4_9BURK|nr:MULTISPECIES: (2Fe-2S)-binding protein [Polynucleobacter]ANI99198.1 (2Fe-2S)-binding protein [Polynucleobacter wuianus]MBU3552224.1 (2Fe-2S)-binding protein [Polynucleobacter sp. MWH-Post4-6-1]MBU3608993.1 (2Fe-2S)-binding protein [Polynucleobacter wuianus]
MSLKKKVSMTVNGVTVNAEIEPRRHLVDFLREDLHLKGPHLGCEQGACGACTVKVDDQIIRGCLFLAVQADGCVVETVEGLTKNGVLADLQESFMRHNAMQCGFCSSGMLLAAAELIEMQPKASREEVREWISGNYCRCTGYHAIVDAIVDVLDARAKGQKIKPVVAHA